MSTAGISLIEGKCLLSYSESSLENEEQVVIGDRLISATKSGASKS